MRSTRRAAATCLVVAFVTALAACTTPTGGGTTPTTTPADYTVCPTAGPGQVRVAVVVDGNALSSTAPPVVCVVVAAGSNGVTALIARAVRIGGPTPRFDSSGLLCAIDANPAAPACGAATGVGGFAYWSYWSGGASWTFATQGPATHTLVDGSVEGWRFLTGGAELAPAGPSQFGSLVS